MNNKLNFSLIKIDNQLGYDLIVTAENATINDYMMELDTFLDNTIAPCIGCDSCCHERIPVTLQDVNNYVTSDDTTEFIGTIEKYFDLIILNPAVDVKIKQRADGSCIFLNQEESKCNAYYKRSIVCHSHICIPKGDNAEDLRSEIVNQGEDALIAHIIECTKDLPEYNYLQSHKSDYPIMTAFENKSYDNILLKDIISHELWHRVYRPL